MGTEEFHTFNYLRNKLEQCKQHVCSQLSIKIIQLSDHSKDNIEWVSILKPKGNIQVQNSASQGHSPRRPMGIVKAVKLMFGFIIRFLTGFDLRKRIALSNEFWSQDSKRLHPL